MLIELNVYLKEETGGEVNQGMTMNEDTVL